MEAAASVSEAIQRGEHRDLNKKEKDKEDSILGTKEDEERYRQLRDEFREVLEKGVVGSQIRAPEIPEKQKKFQHEVKALLEIGRLQEVILSGEVDETTREAATVSNDSSRQITSHSHRNQEFMTSC